MYFWKPLEYGVEERVAYVVTPLYAPGLGNSGTRPNMRHTKPPKTLRVKGGQELFIAASVLNKQLFALW